MPCGLSFLCPPGRAVSLHVVLTPGSDPLALPEPLQQLVTQHGLEPVVTQVPAHAPRTKERWQEQQSVWPTSFHPPLPGSGAAAPPSIVTPATATYIQQCFRVIVEKAMNACESRAGSLACPHVTICGGKDGGRESRGEGGGGGEREERVEKGENGEREEMQGEAVDERRKEEGHGTRYQCGSCDHTEPLCVQHEGLLQPCCVEVRPCYIFWLFFSPFLSPHRFSFQTSLSLPPSSPFPFHILFPFIPIHPESPRSLFHFPPFSLPLPLNPLPLTPEENLARGRLGHPLGHAVMVAIAAAAARDRALFPSEAAQDKTLFMDGGGEESRGAALSERGGSEAAQGEEKEEREGEQGEGEQRKIELDGEGEEVREAGMEVKRGGKSPPLKRRKGNDVQGLGDPARSAVSPNAPPCSAVRPYLCTGFDAFLLHEPCIMCAMALVHQRVRRVFYAIPSAEGGALGSCWKLHGVKSLNHHYEVFRVDLSQLVNC
ncbi:unnamed protein product [Closterium sp. Naga37s-1]|nr:unnamed protein product [Closterium sp. Naga37s-1]